jgi:hypothetical protein
VLGVRDAVSREKLSRVIAAGSAVTGEQDGLGHGVLSYTIAR